MDRLTYYLKEVLGDIVQFEPVPEKELDRLPFFIKKAFRFNAANLLGRSLLFMELVQDHEEPTTGFIEKQLNTVAETLHKTPVFVFEYITALSRKRLIQKFVNFIVPGKQLFLPTLMLDLREQFKTTQKTSDTLIPSAQVILLYHILNRNEHIETLPLKGLAEKLKYTPMAITKAVESLSQQNLCVITGTKEKYVSFQTPIPELWRKAMPHLVDPVIKTVYVDVLPEIHLMKSNTAALSHYTALNESRQQFRAIEKGVFYNLQKENKLVNPNDIEGAFALEVWKYNPAVIMEGTHVDPLSLYLTLKNHQDERIEQALDKILTDHIW